MLQFKWTLCCEWIRLMLVHDPAVHSAFPLAIFVHKEEPVVINNIYWKYQVRYQIIPDTHAFIIARHRPVASHRMVAMLIDTDAMLISCADKTDS